MIKYIYHELRQLFFNKKTFAILVLSATCIIALFINLSKQQDITYISSDYQYLKQFPDSLHHYENRPKQVMDTSKKIDQEGVDFIKNNIKEYKRLVLETLNNAKNGEMDQYNHNLLQAMYYETILSEGDRLPFGDTYDYLKNKDIVIKIKEKYNLKDISFSYKDYTLDTVSAQTYSSRSLYPWVTKIMEIVDKRIENNYTALTVNSNDSITMIYQFLYHLLPIFIVIIIPLLCFNTFHNDKHMGISNTMLSLPRFRRNIISIKSLLHSMHILVILCIPIVCFSLLLGVQDHFKMISYPMLSYKQGVTSLDFGFNSLEENEIIMSRSLNMSRDEIDSQQFMDLIEYNYIYDGKMLDNSLEIIPFYEFLIYCFILIILLCVFLVNLTIFISAVFKNQFLALTISLSISLLGFFTCSKYNITFIQGLNPFQYLNTPQIVGGTSTYPVLLGIIVLVSYIFILYFATSFVMKRKDV